MRCGRVRLYHTKVLDNLANTNLPYSTVTHRCHLRSSRSPLGAGLSTPRPRGVRRPLLPARRYNCTADSRGARVHDCQPRPLEVTRLPLLLRRPVQPATSPVRHGAAQPVRQSPPRPVALASGIAYLAVFASSSFPVWPSNSLFPRLVAALPAVVGIPATRTAERLSEFVLRQECHKLVSSHTSTQRVTASSHRQFFRPSPHRFERLTRLPARQLHPVPCPHHAPEPSAYIPSAWPAHSLSEPLLQPYPAIVAQCCHCPTYPCLCRRV